MDKVQKRIAVGAGKEPADTVIKNARIVNVFSGEIISGDVAIVDGFFAGVGGEYQAENILDAQNKYLSPAFIDGHVHIESSMVTPVEFAKIQLLHGVTGVICDPHEIANVSGKAGVQYMLDTAMNIPFDCHFMLPSCVPATPFENTGAELTAEDLLPFYDHPKVLGLAEVMNYPGVLNADEGLLKKITDARRLHRKIDGHAAGLTGNQLDVYMAAGITTDHECTTAEEALERLRKGMYVMIREGTAAKELKEVIKAVNTRNSRRFLFVTDDRHLDDVIAEGGIDHLVRMAIAEGVDSVTAIQMASLNAAECFGLEGYGAIAAGYNADFILTDNLTDLPISAVYKNGVCVADQGKLVNFPDDTTTLIPPPELLDSVKLPALKTEDFQIHLDGHLANVIEIIPNSILTKHLITEVETISSLFVPSPHKGLLKLAVIERHHQTGNIGLGIIKGLGLEKGAIATTVSHDSHNLMIAGTSDEDMLFAAKVIGEMQGGLAVVCDGKVLAKLELPISGLLSQGSYEEVNEQLLQINKSLEIIGCQQHFNPFLTLSFLALPVIPEIKLTDKGLFHVRSFQHMNVSASH
ncbi:adenine deaminase [Cytobacillus gottheilii]|uniref:adenine deaminase n=1 Tax=Cytobacillus gottheilii TaxID=859144 RepID=UPI0009BC18C8|nr:adenine deaminase [Cytobacillus gottheilii]